MDRRCHSFYYHHFLKWFGSLVEWRKSQ